MWTDATEAGPTQASTPWVAAGSIPALLRNGLELHQQRLLQGSSLGYGSKKPPSVCHLDKGGYTYIVLESIRLQAAESTNIMWCLKKSIPKMGNCTPDSKKIHLKVEPLNCTVNSSSPSQEDWLPSWAW